jgi:hypothetical protein
MKAFSLLPARSRRYRRGAVFVEAVIIITSLVLFLMGMIFFRRVYNNKLFVMRAARGATLAYAMGGCKANEPRAWLKNDTPLGATHSRGEDKNSQQTTASPPDDPKAKAVYDSLPQAGTDGSFLNPINKVTLSTPVSVVSKNKGFRGDIGSISFVTCDDVVRNGDFGEMVDKITSVF